MRGLQSHDSQRIVNAIITSFAAGPPKTAMIQRIGSAASLIEGPYRVSNQISTLAVGTRVVIQDVTGEGGFVVMHELSVGADPLAPLQAQVTALQTQVNAIRPGVVLEAQYTGIEQATGNTTPTDLVTLTTMPDGITPLSIPVEKPVRIWVPFRKGSGAAVAAQFGITLNGVVVNGPRAVTGVTNAADSGLMIIEIGPRLVNYGNNIFEMHFAATLRPGTMDYFATTAPVPVGPITSIVITGSVGGAGGIAIAVQGIRVYSFPSS